MPQAPIPKTTVEDKGLQRTLDALTSAVNALTGNNVRGTQSRERVLTFEDLDRLNISGGSGVGSGGGVSQTAFDVLSSQVVDLQRRVEIAEWGAGVRYDPIYTWDFLTGAEDFTAQNTTQDDPGFVFATEGVPRFTPSDVVANAQIDTPSLSFDGGIYDRVLMKIRLFSDNGDGGTPHPWTGGLQFENSAHSFGAGNQKLISTADIFGAGNWAVGEWVIVEWDMSAVTDWATTTIEGLRFLPAYKGATTPGREWEIDWIQVAALLT